MTIPLPSLDPAHRQRAILDLAPLLFESCRLLAVVPAVFGTFWNLYRALMPLEDGWRWRVDYVVCIIWVRGFDYSRSLIQMCVAKLQLAYEPNVRARSRC